MSETVRAKFRVSRIERSIGSKEVEGEGGRSRYVPTEMQTVVLNPVYGSGDPAHENTKFWRATPTGEIKLGTVNAEAASLFELDKEYYVDFTPAES